jgi:hypothetical protein
MEIKPKGIYKLNDCIVRKHDEGYFEVKLQNANSNVKWFKDEIEIVSTQKYIIGVL